MSGTITVGREVLSGIGQIGAGCQEDSVRGLRLPLEIKSPDRVGAGRKRGDMIRTAQPCKSAIGNGNGGVGCANWPYDRDELLCSLCSL